MELRVLTTIYYQLNDNSNNASQKIQLKMMYYNHKSDIPAGLLATVTENLFNTLNDFLLLTKAAKSQTSADHYCEAELSCRTIGNIALSRTLNS